MFIYLQIYLFGNKTFSQRNCQREPEIKSSRQRQSIQCQQLHKGRQYELTYWGKNVFVILNEKKILNGKLLNFNVVKEMHFEWILANICFLIGIIYKYQQIKMSIKDRIKFFQNLKANQQPKPLPKPLPKTINNKPEPPKPSTVSEQCIKPIPHQPQIKPTVQVPKQQIHDSPKKQPPKSAQVISQPKPPVISQQPPKQLNNPSKNPQKTVEKEEPRVMSVKERLKLLQQSKMPIFQQPPVLKSCFIPSKKSPFQEKLQPTQDKEQSKPKERVSMPQKVETNEGQKKLSFQEMRMIAEGLLSRTQAPPKPQQVHQTQMAQSREDHLSSQIIQEENSHQIKVELEQQTEKLDEQLQRQVKEEAQKADTDSQIVFKEALKHQPEPTLVTGQSANLSLGVRKTMARRKNNEDFDDL